MMRALLLALVLACPGAALATPNDANLAVIGFAKDGSAFAFEQFGWSSGENYPFSDLAVISTKTGKPFVGAPFQTLIAQDDAPQERARMISYTAAQAMLVGMDITEPGIVVARGSGDPRDPAATSLTFEAPSLGKVSIRLDGAIVKSVGCDAVGVKVKALAIRLLDASGTVIRDLHKEKNPPPERFCPTGYGLAEVRIFPRGDQPPIMAMIIGMNRPRPSGIDRRYLAFVVDLAIPAEAAAGDEEK
jgi:predicted secreted protein